MLGSPGSAGILPALSVPFCEILWLVNPAFWLPDFFVTSRLRVFVLETYNISLSKYHSVYNEIGNLPELVSRINNAIEDLKVDYELIFIDDGSEDGST